jgi:hypothetical protein
MIAPSTRNEAIRECRKLCERFGLSQVYLAEIVGSRRHYLAGYGEATFDQPEQCRLSEKIALFWHGTSSPEMPALCRVHLRGLTARLERELQTREEAAATKTAPPGQENR